MRHGEPVFVDSGAWIAHDTGDRVDRDRAKSQNARAAGRAYTPAQ